MSCFGAVKILNMGINKTQEDCFLSFIYVERNKQYSNGKNYKHLGVSNLVSVVKTKHKSLLPSDRT